MNNLKIVGGIPVVLIAFGLAFMNPANAADYAPLDCKMANSPAERTICSDYGLGQSEARVATLYGVTTSLVAMGQRGTIQDDQRAFLRQRDACGPNAACIRNVYATRVRQLESVISNIQQRGPF